MTLATRNSSPQRQRGNTLTGIIIGLIIGLSIAVVVALVITKGSTPFTDKSGKQGKAPETTSGQAADPNKPLYGNKDAAREANKDFQKEGAAPAAATAAAPAPTAATAAAPAPVAARPASTPAPVAATAPAPTPAAKPAASTPAPTAAAAVAAPPAATETFYLQVGAYRDMGDAESTRAKLALLGYEAIISDRASDAGTLHRVRLGPYPQIEAMNKVRTKLAEHGVDVAVVRNQK